MSKQQQAALSELETTQSESENQPALSTLHLAQLFQKENLDTLNGKVNTLFASWWKKLKFCSKFGSLSVLFFLCGNFSTHHGIWGALFIMLTVLGLAGTLGFTFHWTSFKKKEHLNIIEKLNAFSDEDKKILLRVLSIIMLKDVHEGQHEKNYNFEYPKEFIALAKSEKFFIDVQNHQHCKLVDSLNPGDLVDWALREPTYQSLTQEELLQMIHGYLPGNLEDKVKVYHQLKSQPKAQVDSNNHEIIENDNFKEYL